MASFLSVAAASTAALASVLVTEAGVTAAMAARPLPLALVTSPLLLAVSMASLAD